MDLDYCLMIECEFLLSSVQRAWLHDWWFCQRKKSVYLTWNMYPFAGVHISQLVQDFFHQQLDSHFFGLKGIDANLHGPSALCLDPFSIPPVTHQLPCLPWHKMAHGDDIGPHLLLSVTADVFLPSSSPPTLRWCHLSKEIDDYTFPMACAFR